MNFPLPARLSANFMFGSGAALLAALAAYPWLAPLPPSPRPVTADHDERQPAQVAPILPLNSFSAVFDRPLFSPSRRPAPADRSQVGSSEAAGQYRLLGVLSTDGTWRALISDGQRRVDVLEGTTLDGWTVQQIDQDGVVLSSPTGRVTLKLPRPGELGSGPISPEPAER